MMEYWNIGKMRVWELLSWLNGRLSKGDKI
jgi:hypothetical protein